MRVLSINNSTNFQGRIKISKPQNLKTLATGTALIGAGASSMVTGLDASNIIPDLGFTKNIYDSVNNEQIVHTDNGLVLVNNEVAASKVGSTMLGALPVGSVLTSLGSTIIKKTDETSKDNKSIPS